MTEGGEGLGTLPDAHGEAAAEEHVEQVLHLVGHLEAKPLADHHMPRAAKLLVHGLLDHLCRTLRERERDRERDHQNDISTFYNVVLPSSNVN